MDLSKLIEQRDAAQKAYRAFVTPLIEENRALSDEETAQKTELRGAVDRLNDSIAEVQQDNTRDAQIAEARKASGLDRVAPTNVSVIREERQYSEHGEHSFLKDLAVAQMHGMHGASVEAQQRLARHNLEQSVEVAEGSEEGRKVERVVREESRSLSLAKSQISEMRERGRAGAAELRTGLTTATGSGGAFAPPVYLLDLYAPFRTAGRSFIDACQSKPLPASGMTIEIPAIQNAAGVGTQSSQNTAVTETDPDAAYISASVTTLAGEITVSQQLLDRTGPWDGSYDSVMFDQLTRYYNTQADTFALTQALAGAGDGTGAWSSGSISIGSIYSKVNGAESIIRSTAGVFRNPTAMFVIPARWSWMASQVDSEGRPLIVPNAQSPMNALSSGGDNPGVEGFTGYNMAGLDVYQDANIPTPAAGNDQFIVLDPSAVLVFEGNLVPRVLPQTLGNQLSVLLQVYAYIAVLPLYPTAVQQISGSEVVAPTF